MGTTVALILSASLSLFPPGEGPQPDAGVATFDQITPRERGDHGPRVELLQSRLTKAGFRPGDINGEYGKDTYQAVLAFEKYHGLRRDGVFEPSAWDLLDVEPTVRMRSQDDRFEVDLDKQVLYVVRDNDVETVVGISSASGGTYTNYAGRTVTSKTPEGEFSFYLERDYNHRSYLGTMYKPYYFYGGYAIHGSPSAPGYPASHGCVRVTNADMDFLRTELELGMTIMLYGQRTSNPEGITLPAALGATPV